MSFFPTEIPIVHSPHLSHPSFPFTPRVPVNMKLRTDGFAYHVFDRYPVTMNAMNMTINVDLIVDQHESSLFDDTITLERLANQGGAGYGKDFFKKFALMVRKNKNKEEPKKHTFLSMLIDLVNKRKKKKKPTLKLRTEHKTPTEMSRTIVVSKNKKVVLPQIKSKNSYNKITKKAQYGKYELMKTERSYISSKKPKM